jgi:hypothetical protein
VVEIAGRSRKCLDVGGDLVAIDQAGGPAAVEAVSLAACDPTIGRTTTRKGEVSTRGTAVGGLAGASGVLAMTSTSRRLIPSSANIVLGANSAATPTTLTKRREMAREGALAGPAVPTSRRIILPRPLPTPRFSNIHRVLSPRSAKADRKIGECDPADTHSGFDTEETQSCRARSSCRSHWQPP